MKAFLIAALFVVAACAEDAVTTKTVDLDSKESTDSTKPKRTLIEKPFTTNRFKDNFPQFEFGKGIFSTKVNGLNYETPIGARSLVSTYGSGFAKPVGNFQTVYSSNLANTGLYGNLFSKSGKDILPTYSTGGIPVGHQSNIYSTSPAFTTSGGNTFSTYSSGIHNLYPTGNIQYSGLPLNHVGNSYYGGKDILSSYGYGLNSQYTPSNAHSNLLLSNPLYNTAAISTYPAHTYSTVQSSSPFISNEYAKAAANLRTNVRVDTAHQNQVNTLHTITKQVPVPYPQPYPVKVTKTVQIPQPYPVQVTRNVEVPYKVQVPVEVPKPVAVHVPHPVPVPVQVRVNVPVEKPYPVPVTKVVKVPVEKPVYVKVPEPYTVKVPQPYTVHKPVQVPVPTPVAVQVPTPVAVHVPTPVAVHVQTPTYGHLETQHVGSINNVVDAGLLSGSGVYATEGHHLGTHLGGLQAELGLNAVQVVPSHELVSGGFETVSATHPVVTSGVYGSGFIQGNDALLSGHHGLEAFGTGYNLQTGTIASDLDCLPLHGTVLEHKEPHVITAGPGITTDVIRPSTIFARSSKQQSEQKNEKH